MYKAIDINEFNQRAKSLFKENQAFYKRLKLKNPKDLDKVVHRLHEEVFEEIDCLACANCCKTTSPAFYMMDIDRLSKAMKVRSAEFVDSWLRLDDDGAYMFTVQPCPFLGEDHYCSYYDSRPLACREYPHSDRKRFIQILQLSLKNTLICPAILRITEELKKIYL